MADPIKMKKREAKRIETSPGETKHARDKNYNKKYQKAKKVAEQMKKDGKKPTRDDYGYYKTFQGDSGSSMKKFPEIKEKNEGKFTKWVEKNMPGVDTCKAASKIMRSKTKKYSPSVVKMANYANNFGCKTKKEGASFNPKLKKAVADGKIKGKFADAVMKG